MSDTLRVKVHGLDCAEEVAALRREVGPAVGGEERLLEVVLARMHSPARYIQNALIDAVHRFAGSAQDDVALIVMRRLA